MDAKVLRPLVASFRMESMSLYPKNYLQCAQCKSIAARAWIEDVPSSSLETRLERLVGELVLCRTLLQKMEHLNA